MSARNARAPASAAAATGDSRRHADAPGRGALLAAFAAVYVAWGSTYLAIRIGVASFPPPVLAGLRFTVAGTGMLLALRVAGRPIVPSARALRDLAIVGALLLLGGNGLVVWAEQFVASGLTALIIATVPLWMAGLAALPPARECLPPRAVVGLALGLAGVAVLVAPGLSEGGSIAAEGALLVAALSWSCGSLYARRTTATLDPLVATAWEMLIGGALFLVIAAITGAVRATHATPAGLGALLYLIVFGSWIGFTAYVWLLAHAPAAKVATYAYVNPVIAVLLGWWVLDERISRSVVIGSAIIVVAVALVTTARVQQPPAPAAPRPLEVPGGGA